MRVGRAMDSHFRDMRLVNSHDEINRVFDLARIIWVDHYSPIIGLEQVNYMLDNFHSRNAIEDDIRVKGFKYFLIRNNGRDVGYLAFKHEKTSLFLSKIYILSSERGQGLGKRALAFVRDQAKRCNLRSIRLTVNKNNSGSISAYERIGFQKTGEVKADIGHGYFMDDFSMEWKI